MKKIAGNPIFTDFYEPWTTVKEILTVSVLTWRSSDRRFSSLSKFKSCRIFRSLIFSLYASLTASFFEESRIKLICEFEVLSDETLWWSNSYRDEFPSMSALILPRVKAHNLSSKQPSESTHEIDKKTLITSKIKVWGIRQKSERKI